LAGEKSARRDVVLLNSAAALVAAGRADSLAHPMPLPAGAPDSRAARGEPVKHVQFTSRPPPDKPPHLCYSQFSLTSTELSRPYAIFAIPQSHAAARCGEDIPRLDRCSRRPVHA